MLLCAIFLKKNLLCPEYMQICIALGGVGALMEKDMVSGFQPLGSL